MLIIKETLIKVDPRKDLEVVDTTVLPVREMQGSDVLIALGLLGIDLDNEIRGVKIKVGINLISIKTTILKY